MYDNQAVGIITKALVDLFCFSKLSRCARQEDDSGHNFLTYPPFSSMSLEGVKIVRVCTYCGKILEDEVKGLAKLHMNVGSRAGYDDVAN